MLCNRVSALAFTSFPAVHRLRLRLRLLSRTGKTREDGTKVADANPIKHIHHIHANAGYELERQPTKGQDIGKERSYMNIMNNADISVMLP